MERPYITVDTSVVPHQILPNRVEYAVSSKHVSVVSGDDSPPDYSYIMLEEKKVNSQSKLQYTPYVRRYCIICNGVLAHMYTVCMVHTAVCSILLYGFIGLYIFKIFYPYYIVGKFGGTKHRRIGIGKNNFGR